MTLITKLYFPLTIILFSSSLLLHLLPRLGKPGKQLSDQLCYAPVIDLVLAYFMLLPLIVGLSFAGWKGMAISLLAEITALWLWIIFHELIHLSSQQKPKISRTMSRIVGFGRNHLAVWITALAVPCFWLVRFTEIIVYPPLTWLIGLPKYQTKEWVNVSRHKFEGLVGYDLIWCLYCDWMTGVWSLGTEMLRNVESFWCPIRFYDGKKCDNCKLDFPDLETGWVAADGTMDDVEKLLEQKYCKEQHSWFSHPDRQQ